MPSQEDYLDNLLKDMAANGETPEEPDTLAGMKAKEGPDAPEGFDMGEGSDVPEEPDLGKGPDEPDSGEELNAMEGLNMEGDLNAMGGLDLEELNLGEDLDSEEEPDSLEGLDSLGDLESEEEPDSLEGLDLGEDLDPLESLDLGEGLDSLGDLESEEEPDSLEGLDLGEGLDSLGGLESEEEPDSLEGLDLGEDLDSLEGLDLGEGLDSLEGLESEAESSSLEGLDLGEDLDSLEGLDLGEGLDSLSDLGSEEEPDSLEGLAELSAAETPEAEFDDAGMPYDLSLVSELTEEGIERLLTESEVPVSADLLQGSDADLSDEDVLKMLEESDDSELQEIQELLTKADNNEAVDDSIEELLRDTPEEDAEARVFEESEEAEELPVKMTAKEKKELAREERERKKEQAAAQKAEKKAAREAARAAKKKGGKAQGGKKTVREAAPAEDEEDFSAEADMSVLDTILSEADGKDEAEKQAQAERREEMEKILDGLDLEGEHGDTLTESDLGTLFGDDGEPEDLQEEAAEDDDDAGLGLDGLFGDGDPDMDLMGDGGSDFPDFLEMDVSDADALGSEQDEDSEQEKGQGKKPLLSKFMDFLSEEDEENEDIKLSRENEDILKDLDKEKGGKGSKGKKAKGKEKKEPKPKKEKPKKPKKEKPKKEKPPKERSVTPPGKKLSFKRVFPIILIGVSLGVLVYVFANSAAEYTDKVAARAAYYEEDYQTCYQNLFGKDLNETESVMFGRSESILYIRLWLREYEMFVDEGSEAKALDSLIQSVVMYPDLYEYAIQWNAGPDVAAGYATLLNILESKYSLTESQALEIAAERSDIQYTRIVTAIAGGKTLDNWNQPDQPAVFEEPPVEEDEMSDVLPEEEELGQDTFIDNQ